MSIYTTDEKQLNNTFFFHENSINKIINGGVLKIEDDGTTYYKIKQLKGVKERNSFGKHSSLIKMQKFLNILKTNEEVKISKNEITLLEAN